MVRLLEDPEQYKNCEMIEHIDSSIQSCSSWDFTLLFMTCNFNLIWPLQAVKKGDTIFIGQYLFTGNETTSVWLEASSFIGACHVTYFSCQVYLSHTISSNFYC